MFQSQADEAVQTAEDHGATDASRQQVNYIEESGQSEPQEGSEERGLGQAEASESGHSGEKAKRSSDVTSDATEQVNYRLTPTDSVNVTSNSCCVICSCSRIVPAAPQRTTYS